MIMEFRITPEEQKVISEWLESIKPMIMAKSVKDPMGDIEPYYGAIGGGLTYSFTPTGLGVVVKVKEYYTGEELNLTDYDSW